MSHIDVDVEEATLTLRREEEDITCLLLLPYTSQQWLVWSAIGEDGRDVDLTEEERARLSVRAEAGEDEAGY